LAMTVASPVFAACQDDIQPVINQLNTIHDSLAEADHVKVEQAIGQAMTFCHEGQEADAQTKIAEAKSLLGMN